MFVSWFKSELFFLLCWKTTNLLNRMARQGFPKIFPKIYKPQRNLFHFHRNVQKLLSSSRKKDGVVKKNKWLAWILFSLESTYKLCFTAHILITLPKASDLIQIVCSAVGTLKKKSGWTSNLKSNLKTKSATHNSPFEDVLSNVNRWRCVPLDRMGVWLLSCLCDDNLDRPVAIWLGENERKTKQRG